MKRGARRARSHANAAPSPPPTGFIWCAWTTARGRRVRPEIGLDRVGRGIGCRRGRSVRGHRSPRKSAGCGSPLRRRSCASEQMRDFRRGRLGAVDERHAFRGLRDGASKQRKMRAAEHQRIRRVAALEYRRQITLCRPLRHFAVGPAFFGERDEQAGTPSARPWRRASARGWRAHKRRRARCLRWR